MSSSTNNDDNIMPMPCEACDKEDNDSTEDTASRQLTLQIENLSIENEKGNIAKTNNAENTDNMTTSCAACGKEDDGDNMKVCYKCEAVKYCNACYFQHIIVCNTTEDIISPMTTCANCGKEGDINSMNTCNKCKFVIYCNAACKKKHRHKHKKACERRVADLHDAKLFKEHPPSEDCLICFLPLPLDSDQIIFEPCCGKSICKGCSVTIRAKAKEMRDAAIDGRGKKKEWDMCAFCRTPHTKSDKEGTRRIKILVENGNAKACNALAGYYHYGSNGVQQDYTKANELYLKAGELGCAEAYYNLGCSYSNGLGVETDKKKGIRYFEFAAIGGNVPARHALGAFEMIAGNNSRSIRHFLLGAEAGYVKSMDIIEKMYMTYGMGSKDEYEQIVRSYQKRQEGMKSDTRKAFAIRGANQRTK